MKHDINDVIRYSSKNKYPVMDDVFWLLHPTTFEGIAAFELEGKIYLAVKQDNKSYGEYWVDSGNPVIIAKEKVEKFIELKKCEGMCLIFNTLTDEYNSTHSFSEKEIETSIGLVLESHSYSDARVFRFTYRDFKQVIPAKADHSLLTSFKTFINSEDLRIPHHPEKELKREEIIHRFRQITKELKGVGKIKMQVGSQHFQSLRHVLQYASTHPELDLLKEIHREYVLVDLEPVPAFLIPFVVNSTCVEAQKYYLDNVPYAEYPWNAEPINSILRRGKEEVRKQIKTKEGLQLYNRYFEEN